MRGGRFCPATIEVLNFVLGRVIVVVGLGGLEILLRDDVVPLFETLLFLRF